MSQTWVTRVAPFIGVAWMWGCTSVASTPPPRDADLAVDASAVVEEELDRLVEEGATRASIVVLDPNDGRIVARGGRGPAGSAEAQRVAETGSTIKPLTIAAAIEAGLDPERRFDGEGGEWQPTEGPLLRDWQPRESLDARDVLVSSSNVGAGKIVEAVGEASVARTFEALGVRIPEMQSWPVHGAGIGTTMSPTELAAAYAVFANGGFAVEPTETGDGSRRRVFSERTATTVASMLEAAVGDEGTGRRARVEGHRVGGKTGTTADGAAVFAGIAPIDGPRYVIVVRVERPGEIWGGMHAAPSFRRVASALLSAEI